MNTANKLTIFRILMVPIMVIIPLLKIPGEILGVPVTYIIVFVIFTIAALTDKLDGHIARSRNQITTFGKFLDPIADKILVIAALVMLVEIDRLPAWIPIIVITREFIVSGYRLVVTQKDGKVVAANLWGKLKTVTQMFAIGFAFIDVNPYFAILNTDLDLIPFILNLVTSVLMTISVIATILSGITYLKGSKDLFKTDM